MAKRSPRKKLKDECDKLWAKLVKERAKGLCEVCGRPAIHAHHMVGRTRLFLRHRLENGVALCYACHSHFHNTEAVTMWEWFARVRSEDCEFVRSNFNTLGKDVDLQEVRRMLDEL